MILVTALIIIAFFGLPTLVTEGNTHFKHMLEWNYFVGVILFYLLSRFFGEEPHKFLGFRQKFSSFGSSF